MSNLDKPTIARWATSEAGFRAGALPILSWGITVIEQADGPDEVFPAVEVDVRGRPDVADLPRVHASDGPGSMHAVARLFERRRRLFSYGGAPQPSLLRIDTVVSSPVTCVFAVVLELGRHRHVLDHIAFSNSLVLATTPGPDLSSARWLSLSLDGGAIGELLRVADTSRR